MKTSALKRSAPMVRTSFKSEPKPAAGPKPKKCANRACRAPYLPDPKRKFKNWCNDDCALVIALDKLDKQKAKKQQAERVADKAKLDTYKSYPKLVREAQTAFNAFIRLRDAEQPCICCGRAETMVEGLHSHGWDCGHFRSTGAAPQLRFNEDNAHRQLVYCNRNLAGNAVAYRAGLIARIGLARVEALEADNTPRKWTHDELRAMKAHYTAKVRELKKEHA